VGPQRLSSRATTRISTGAVQFRTPVDKAQINTLNSRVDLFGSRRIRRRNNFKKFIARMTGETLLHKDSRVPLFAIALSLYRREFFRVRDLRVPHAGTRWRTGAFGAFSKTCPVNSQAANRFDGRVTVLQQTGTRFARAGGRRYRPFKLVSFAFAENCGKKFGRAAKPVEMVYFASLAIRFDSRDTFRLALLL
jgi:hypothetical protein